MQKDSPNANGTNNPTNSSPILSQSQHVSSAQANQTNSDGFDSQDSSVYHPKPSLPTSVSLTPSHCACYEESNATATENRLYLARLTLEYQELVDRYGLCLAHLEEATKEAEILRQENAKLRMVNKDLTKRLSLLTQASLQNRYLSPGFPSLSIINDFRSLCVGDSGRSTSSLAPAVHQTRDTSPIAGTASHGFDERRSGERDSLPKSISIRSSGFLKVNPSVSASNNVSSDRPTNFRVRPPTPVITNGTQRVYVPGESKEDCALELDVYNQGMFKTELCNKWQETGTCPYGDHCQFAHGIGELRPVIRHPRYKTEVCRMVLSGDNCPYGHRCHFRHALTEQERFMGRGGLL